MICPGRRQDDVTGCDGGRNPEYHAIAISYNAILYNTIQYHIISYNAMQYFTIPCNMIQCNAMQYNAIQYHAMQAEMVVGAHAQNTFGILNFRPRCQESL